MSDKVQKMAEISPKVTPRDCGGWLATAPDGSAIKIGVTASTEGEAKAKFQGAVSRWVETLTAS